MKSLWRCLFSVTIVLLGTGSAQAADEIGVSRDGVTWSSSLPGGLFDSISLWVPGDSETEAFYVRNQGPSNAFLTIEARSADTDELLSNHDIALRVRVDAGPWVDLVNGEPSESLSQQSIGQGDSVQVDVSATFDPASTNESQGKELALSFSVTLADSLEGDDGDDGDDGGLLPGTGAQLSAWLLVLAGVMLVVGSRLARRGQEARHD